MFGRLDADSKLPAAKILVRRAAGTQREEVPTVEGDFLITWKLRRDARFANVLEAIESLPTLDRFDLFNLIIAAGLTSSLETGHGRPRGARRKTGLTPATIESLAAEAHDYWSKANRQATEPRSASATCGKQATFAKREASVAQISIRGACRHVIREHLRNGLQRGWPGEDRVIRVVSEALRRRLHDGDKRDPH